MPDAMRPARLGLCRRSPPVTVGLAGRAVPRPTRSRCRGPAGPRPRGWAEFMKPAFDPEAAARDAARPREQQLVGEVERMGLRKVGAWPEQGHRVVLAREVVAGEACAELRHDHDSGDVVCEGERLHRLPAAIAGDVLPGDHGGGRRHQEQDEVGDGGRFDASLQALMRQHPIVVGFRLVAEDARLGL